MWKASDVECEAEGLSGRWLWNRDDLVASCKDGRKRETRRRSLIKLMCSVAVTSSELKLKCWWKASTVNVEASSVKLESQDSCQVLSIRLRCRVGSP